MPQFILSMLIFGTVGLFVRGIDLPSSTIALARGLMGAAFLVCAALALRKSLCVGLSRSTLTRLFVSGVFLGLNWIFLFEAYRHTTIAAATLSYYTAPAIMTLLSPFVLKEKLSTKKLVCLAVCFVGMGCVVGTEPGSLADGGLIGIGFGLIAASFYAAVVLNNKFLGPIAPTTSSVIQLGSAAAAILPYVLATTDFASMSVGMDQLGLLIVVGIVHTGVAYFLYFSALPKLSTQRVSIFSYIDPAFAVVLSILVLAEPFTAMTLIGAFLILGAALASEL